MGKKYLSTKDVPNLENYLALAGAILSKKPISVNEALQRVGISLYSDEYREEANDNIAKIGERSKKSPIQRGVKLGAVKKNYYVENVFTGEWIKCEGIQGVHKLIGISEGAVSGYISQQRLYKYKYLIHRGGKIEK